MSGFLAVGLILELAVAPAPAGQNSRGHLTTVQEIKAAPRSTQSGIRAPRGEESSRQAAAILERARAALGGTGRLGAVKALTSESKVTWASTPERAQPFGFAMLLPDRFRRRTVDIVHTVDGAAFWQSHESPPEIRKQAEANIRATFVKTALVFLLRPLPWFPLDARRIADATLGKLRAQVVEFRGRDHFVVRLLFDPVTSQLLGYSVPWDVNGASVERLVRLEDYREVSGIRVPFRLVDTLGGQPNNTEVFTDIHVNPSLTAADFKKK
jgi:hypothetical protein